MKLKYQLGCPGEEAISTPGKVRQLVDRIEPCKKDSLAKETEGARKIAVGGRAKKRLLVLKGQKRMFCAQFKKSRFTGGAGGQQKEIKGGPGGQQGGCGQACDKEVVN